MAEIERKLQSADALIGSARNLLTKPAVITGALALLFATRRLGWWAALSRGAFLFATVRRIYRIIKTK